MNYEFDNPPSRKNSASIKWDQYDESVLPMWLADMDFASAPEILEYLKQKIDFGILGYTHPPKELDDIIIKRVKELFNWDIKKEWLVYLPGLVCALTLACKTFGKDGDKILIQTPIYPPFLKVPAVARRQKITLPLELNANKTEWVLDLKLLEETIIKEKISVLLLCNPHNPLGKIYSEFELKTIAEICNRHNVLICSDEIHNELIMNPNKKHICIASLSKETENNSITLMAPSKTFNLPGLCCSFAIIPNLETKIAFEKAGEYLVPHAGILGYAGCYAAFQFGDPWKQAMLKYVRENLDICMTQLQKIPKIFILKPDATYMIWIDVRELYLKQPGKYFESKGLGLTDGFIFKGDGYLRLNFATSRKILLDGLNRFEKAVKEIAQ